MQAATHDGNEAPGLEAGREREAAEQACEASLAACPVQEEDPSWVWLLTTQQANEIASAIYAGEGYLTVSDISGVIKHALHVDWLKQAEELVEKEVFGFTQGEVESWALNLAGQLDECVGLALYGYEKPKNPHCWVYVPTSKKRYGFETPFGFAGLEFEVPEFGKDLTVAYCPHGTQYCGGAL
jgi:hypothetical protein